MTSATNANVVKLDMKHYIEKIKEHEEKRLSTNERMAYWTNYFKNK